MKESFAKFFHASEGIKFIVKLCSGILAMESHGHIFCAWIEVDGWYQRLQGRKEQVLRDEQKESDDGAGQQTLLEVKMGSFSTLRHLLVRLMTVERSRSVPIRPMRMQYVSGETVLNTMTC